MILGKSNADRRNWLAAFLLSVEDFRGRRCGMGEFSSKPPPSETEGGAPERCGHRLQSRRKNLSRRRRGIGSEGEDWVYRAGPDGTADGDEFVEGGARGDGVESHGVARG